jgi:hypothetical protein
MSANGLAIEEGRTVDIRTISDFRKAMRHGPYVWPGGYPVFFVMADGEALSFAAAKAERRNVLAALAANDRHSGWLPVGLEVNWADNSLYCAHTGERIESAYGED